MYVFTRPFFDPAILFLVIYLRGMKIRAHRLVQECL